MGWWATIPIFKSDGVAEDGVKVSRFFFFFFYEYRALGVGDKPVVKV